MIHGTAIIHEGATIGPDCEVGPYSIIGSQVKLGARTKVGPHVVIEGHTTLGDENVVFQFASIGSAPQDLKYRGEPTEVILGSRNTIREYVTIQPGTVQGSNRTVVGNGNLFMGGTHIAHDAVIGDANIFANYCCLAGHVTVGNRVTVGGLAGIHQFVRLGDICIVGAGAMVSQDIPPFCMAHGDHAQLVGLNRIGLKRSGVNPKDALTLRNIFRDLFYATGAGQPEEDADDEGGESEATREYNRNFRARLEQVGSKVEDFALGKAFIDFISAPSKRGIASPRKRSR